MSKQGRILIVDDEIKWGKELAEVLRRKGFNADAVENVSQALERLNKTLYHIVVLDIRLPSSSEGIGLLKELERRGLKEATKVIMHSAYGTLEHMRLAFKDYEVADFVPKTTAEAFLQSVQQVFDQKVKINPALDIKWQMKNTVEQVVRDLKISGKEVGSNTTLRKQLVEELDDLFCRLFHEAEMVLVRPLTPGWSGTGIALVQPFFKGRGRGKDVVVKFGDRDKIKKEHYNFQQYVRPFLSGGRSTAIQDLRYTPHLGGIVYTLLGAGNDQLVDFAEFYRRTDDITQIIQVLNSLFQSTCANWYINRSRIEPLDLAVDYQRFFNYSPKKFERILASQLPSIHLGEKLIFPSLRNKRTFTNPFLVNIGQSFTHYTATCMMHGLTAPEATLEERLQMEEALCEAEHLSQGEASTRLVTDNQALAKAYATVTHLRTLASSVAAQNPQDTISEYSIALFYNALNTLKFSSLKTVQHEHALLCASLLATRLDLDI